MDHFWRKNWHATIPVPMGIGPQNPTKKLAHLEDFMDQPLCRKLFWKLHFDCRCHISSLQTNKCVQCTLRYMGWAILGWYFCQAYATPEKLCTLRYMGWAILGWYFKHMQLQRNCTWWFRTVHIITSYLVLRQQMFADFITPPLTSATLHKPFLCKLLNYLCASIEYDKDEVLKVPNFGESL